jgi:hypothetical protein
VLGLALAASSASAQDRGTCVTAQVPEAFTLPDGSLHVAGKFTLCVHSALNPVAGLHRLSTDAEGTILVKSKRTLAREYADRQPVLLFFRPAPGEPLDLVGYVVPFDRKTWKYTLKSPEEIRPFESASLGAPTPAGEFVTLLALNGN